MIPKLSDMTPEQKRVAIAEAVGWKFWSELAELSAHQKLWLHPQHQKISDMETHLAAIDHARSESQLPDYLADLNAIHEAEAMIYEPNTLPRDKIRRAKWNAYVEWLARISALPGEDICYATAAQRCDAFLLAKGLATL